MTTDAAALAAANTGLVYSIAREQQRVLQERDFGELVGDGMVGLVQAAQRFDPDNGASFSTFACRRVRGAMVDGYRTRNRTGYVHSSGPAPVLTSLDARASDASRCDSPTFQAEMPSAPSAEDQALDRFALARMLERIADLPERQRETVHAVMDGGRFKAIAERDGVTVAAVSQRFMTAKRRLVA